jgi:subtilase family serine protease
MSRSIPSHPSRFFRPRLEELEPRALPSAAGWVAAPHWNAVPLGSGGVVTYTPATIRSLYGFDQTWATGYGQSLAVVVANDAPTVFNDLIAFDRAFGLPGQGGDIGYYLTKLNQYGQWYNYPAPDAGWAGEADLDVQWAHAIAPYAHIYLVEANSSGLGDLLTAVNTARNLPGVGVVSMSWGGGEFGGEAYYDGYFTTPYGHTGVSFVAAAGDGGAYAGADWPAISSNVLAVGGTSLYGYTNETAWAGGGGGVSQFEAEPGWQYSLQGAGRRTNPDVSYDANPATGVYVFNSYTAAPGWYSYGGTSVGAPQWAALLTLADQVRAYFGEVPLANAQALLAQLPGYDFRDVGVGSNGYPAGPGYDLATGRGSPYAPYVLEGLTFTYTPNYGGSWSTALPGGGPAAPRYPHVAAAATDAAALGDLTAPAPPTRAADQAFAEPAPLLPRTAQALDRLASVNAALPTARWGAAAVVEDALRLDERDLEDLL